MKTRPTSGGRKGLAVLLTFSVLFASGGAGCLAAVSATVDAAGAAGAAHIPSGAAFSRASPTFISAMRRTLAPTPEGGIQPIAGGLASADASALQAFFGSFDHSDEELMAAGFLENAFLTTPGSLSEPEKFKQAFEDARGGMEAAYRDRAEQIRGGVLHGHENAGSLERENDLLTRLAARAHFLKADVYPSLDSVRKMAWAAHSERGMEAARDVAKKLAAEAKTRQGFRETLSVWGRQGTAALHSLLQPAGKVRARPRGLIVPMVDSAGGSFAEIGGYRIQQSPTGTDVGVFRVEKNGAVTRIHGYSPGESLSEKRIAVARDGSLSVLADNGAWKKLKGRWLIRLPASFAPWALAKDLVLLCGRGWMKLARFGVRMSGRAIGLVRGVRSTANDVPMPTGPLDDNLRQILLENPFARSFADILATFRGVEWSAGTRNSQEIVRGLSDGRNPLGVRSIEIIKEGDRASLRLQMTRLDSRAQNALIDRIRRAENATREATGHRGFAVGVERSTRRTTMTLPSGESVGLNLPEVTVSLADEEAPKDNAFFFQSLRGAYGNLPLPDGIADARLREALLAHAPARVYADMLSRLPRFAWRSRLERGSFSLNGVREVSSADHASVYAARVLMRGDAAPDLQLYSLFRNETEVRLAQRRAQQIQERLARLYATFRVGIERTSSHTLRFTLSGDYPVALNSEFFNLLPYALDGLLDEALFEILIRYPQAREFSRFLSHLSHFRWTADRVSHGVHITGLAEAAQGALDISHVDITGDREEANLFIHIAQTEEALAHFRRQQIDDLAMRTRQAGEDPSFQVEHSPLGSTGVVLMLSSKNKPASNDFFLRNLLYSTQKEDREIQAALQPSKPIIPETSNASFLTLSQVLSAYPQARAYSPLLAKFSNFIWGASGARLDGMGSSPKDGLPVERILAHWKENGNPRVQLQIMPPDSADVEQFGKFMKTLAEDAARKVFANGQKTYAVSIKVASGKVELDLPEGFDPRVHNEFVDYLTQAYLEAR